MFDILANISNRSGLSPKRSESRLILLANLVDVYNTSSTDSEIVQKESPFPVIRGANTKKKGTVTNGALSDFNV